MAPASSSAPAKAGKYFADTRGWTYSAAVVVPVLFTYEIGIWVLNRALGIPVRNGADVLLQQLASVAGPLGRTGLPLLVVLVLAGLVWNERRHRPIHLRQRFLAGMVLESGLYAVLFGALIARATALLIHGGPRLDAAPNITQMPILAQVVLSLGAGIYEEILFRGMLLGFLRSVFGIFSGVSKALREAAAVLIAAAIFSAYHYVGPFGDPFAVSSFTFRLLFGVVFSGLLVARGFGVTVLTHALYDVLVTLGL